MCDYAISQVGRSACCMLHTAGHDKYNIGQLLNSSSGLLEQHVEASVRGQERPHPVGAGPGQQRATVVMQ